MRAPLTRTGNGSEREKVTSATPSPTLPALRDMNFLKAVGLTSLERQAHQEAARRNLPEDALLPPPLPSLVVNELSMNHKGAVNTGLREYNSTARSTSQEPSLAANLLTIARVALKEVGSFLVSKEGLPILGTAVAITAIIAPTIPGVYGLGVLAAIVVGGIGLAAINPGSAEHNE